MVLNRFPLWKNILVIVVMVIAFFYAAPNLFPEDPAIVDYPFYVLGRWINDQKLSIRLLRTFLKFWQEIYRKIGKPPIS